MLALQFLVYNHSLREKLFGVNSVLEMSVSAMNDLIWIPVALALPFYVARLAKRRFHRIKKRYLIPAAVVAIVLGLLNLQIYFNFLFILILLYVLLFFMTAQRFVSIHYSFVLYTFCMVYVLMHYGGQLFPQILPESHKNTVKLITYNVKVDQQPDEHARILEYIEKEQPDIVCIQEFSTDIRAMLEEHFADTFDYMHFSTRWGDYRALAVLSRFPITDHEILKIHSDVSKTANDLLYVKLNIHDREVHLLNTHLYHGGNNLKRALAGKQVRQWLKRAGSDYDRHREEAYQLHKLLEKTQTPVILAADLNDTPNSAVYHLFSKKYKNAFAEKGWGLGTTYGLWSLLDNIPAFWRFLFFDFLRIDHVFFSPDIKIHTAQVPLFDASDHRPLVVTFSF